VAHLLGSPRPTPHSPRPMLVRAGALTGTHTMLLSRACSRLVGGRPIAARALARAQGAQGGVARALSSEAMQRASPAVPDLPDLQLPENDKSASDALIPGEVVKQLDRYIIGQAEAKKATAVAIRNRWRRQQVPPPLRDEITPKNILMIGPTGVGKTEIARRLAKMIGAPFIKVEATKFTEVGFVGRDVEQIIRDLADHAITMVRAQLVEKKRAEIAVKVEEKILDQLVGENSTTNRDSFRALLRQGLLDTRTIDVDVPEPRRQAPLDTGNGNPNSQPMNEIILRFDKLLQQGGRRSERRQMTIAEARPVLEEVYSEKIISEEDVKKAALHSVEQEGIVFIDEIDKICSRTEYRGSADASSEGVQRDLLPLIEGSTVSTKHGNINTDHILFVCSGAFHQCKPSDLLAELQGRLPIRVELQQLTEEDLYRILTEPETSLVRQQEALLQTEAVTLKFEDSALRRVAALAAAVNRDVENIGARRIHTILERVMEHISFTACERAGTTVTIDAAYVDEQVGNMVTKTDLSRFIL